MNDNAAPRNPGFRAPKRFVKRSDSHPLTPLSVFNPLKFETLVVGSCKGSSACGVVEICKPIGSTDMALEGSGLGIVLSQ